MTVKVVDYALKASTVAVSVHIEATINVTDVVSAFKPTT